MEKLEEEGVEEEEIYKICTPPRYYVSDTIPKMDFPDDEFESTEQEFLETHYGAKGSFLNLLSHSKALLPWDAVWCNGPGKCDSFNAGCAMLFGNEATFLHCFYYDAVIMIEIPKYEERVKE